MAYYKKVHGKRKLFHVKGIITPKTCPLGYWPGASEISFEDGTTVKTTHQDPLPQEEGSRDREGCGEMGAEANSETASRPVSRHRLCGRGDEPAGHRRGRDLACDRRAAWAPRSPPRRAQTETSASIRPSLLPDRLGASTALTLAFRFSGGIEGVPAPLRGLVVHLPAGLERRPARRPDLPAVAVAQPRSRRLLVASRSSDAATR